MSIQTGTTFHEAYPNIFVEDKNISLCENSTIRQDNFIKVIKGYIDIISLGEVGKRLLTKIENQKHHIHIIHNPLTNQARPADPAASMTPGLGSSSTIYLSCSSNFLINTKDLEPLENPPYIVLAHELIHAYHNALGKRATSEVMNSSGFSFIDLEFWSNNEEYHTIEGFPSKKLNKQKKKISENEIRKERKLETRFSHREHRYLKTIDKETLKRFKKQQKSGPVTIVKYFIWRNEWEKAIQLAESIKNKHLKKEAFESIRLNVTTSLTPHKAISLFVAHSKFEEALHIVKDLESNSLSNLSIEEIAYGFAADIIHDKIPINDFLSMLLKKKLSEDHLWMIVRIVCAELLKKNRLKEAIKTSDLIKNASQRSELHVMIRISAILSGLHLEFIKEFNYSHNEIENLTNIAIELEQFETAIELYNKLSDSDLKNKFSMEISEGLMISGRKDDALRFFYK